jgi:N-acetylglucosamine kinase-like BadF-type ATPase
VKLFAGIDGGQSSTVAVIGEETGRLLGRGTAGPADEIGAGETSTRLRDALSGALENARRNAALSESSRFEAIVAGISGYDGRVYGRRPELPSGRVRLLHDTPIAHAGALGGRAGIVVIAGTGSVVYGQRDDGWSCSLGGWGFLFGDEGSAFAIAREALARLMRAHDDGDRSVEAEMAAACRFFDVTSLRELVHAFYKGGISRDRLASFAPAALRYDEFRSLALHGADRLAELACAVAARDVPARVAMVGGIFADAALRERVRSRILCHIADAQIVEPLYDPACGALLLAYRETGIEQGALQT